MDEPDEPPQPDEGVSEEYPLVPDDESYPTRAVDLTKYEPGPTGEPFSFAPESPAPERPPPAVAPPTIPAVRRRPTPFQFTLAELLLVITGTALVSSVLGLLPLPCFAGVAGVGVLVSLIVLAILKPQRPLVHLAWWALLILYAVATVIALMRR